jgi:hypothetical protein
MKLWGWGGIVPWIGFRLAKVPCEVAAEAGIYGELDDHDEVMVEAFEVEWFGVGMTFSMRGVA